MVFVQWIIYNEFKAIYFLTIDTISTSAFDDSCQTFSYPRGFNLD